MRNQNPNMKHPSSYHTPTFVKEPGKSKGVFGNETQTTVFNHNFDLNIRWQIMRGKKKIVNS